MKRKLWFYPFILILLGIGELILLTGCKKEENKPEIEYGAVTDIDGNSYKTVKIGNQWWMAENLKVIHYNNSSTILNVTDNDDWKGSTTGAYCWYNNDTANYKKTYGTLYNWYAVETGLLCPVGWHVPTDGEWTTLTTYLGESVAGGKLKEVGFAHWTSPNTGATNESGYTALPGGYRYSSGAFYYVGEFGYWWSSTLISTSASARCRTMSYGYSIVYRFYHFKEVGFSVRCLKD